MRRSISSSSARHRVDLHPEFGGRLVDEVDRLVGQEAIGNVSIGQDGRRHEGRVLEAHPVMDLVAIAKPAKNADRVFHGRFADEDRLKSPLERRIFLDVLPVLVERRRADGVKLAASEHRLQHVRRIHRPFGGAGADDGVELVDEQNHLALRVGDLLQDRFQPFFELAPILRAGHERAHIERDDLLVLESFRDVAANDASGQPLDDGGLADAGLADEDGIVLRAS